MIERRETLFGVEWVIGRCTESDLDAHFENDGV